MSDGFNGVAHELSKPLRETRTTPRRPQHGLLGQGGEDDSVDSY